MVWGSTSPSTSRPSPSSVTSASSPTSPRPPTSASSPTSSTPSTPASSSSPSSPPRPPWLPRRTRSSKFAAGSEIGSGTIFSIAVSRTVTSPTLTSQDFHPENTLASGDHVPPSPHTYCFVILTHSCIYSSYLKHIQPSYSKPITITVTV